MRKPCANCPWRVDAPREYWDPEHFISIWRNCQDDGTHLMQCHKSTKTAPLICQGWIRVMGFESIGVRVAAMNGRVTYEEIEDRSVDLFASFIDMLKANKIPLPPRNQRVPIGERVDVRSLQKRRGRTNTPVRAPRTRKQAAGRRKRNVAGSER